MISNSIRLLPVMLLVLSLLTVFSPAAHAGPPLLCHPFEIGKAASLPWAGPEWKGMKASYDINRLVNDTTALLASQTPVLVRMETLRRAAIYAVWKSESKDGGDLRVARELLAQLEARANEAKGKGQPEALALFDLGYLVETYRQALRPDDLSIIKGIDGYTAVARAITMRVHDPEMEFAAAVVAEWPKRPTQMDHLRRSVNEAKDGTLLAKNLTSHFADMGTSIADLRNRLAQ